MHANLLLPIGLTLIIVLVPLGTTSDAATPGPDAVAVPAPVPGADAWRDAATTGTPVTVTWEGRTLHVLVEKNPYVDPAGYAVTDRDGARLDTAHLEAFSGSVVGAPDSTVRVTLADDRIDGMILGIDGHNLGFSTVEGTTSVTTPGQATADLPNVARKIDDDPGEVGGGCGIPLYTMGAATGLVSGWPERVIDIAFAVDDNYANGINGGDWLGATVALANRLDGFYAHENDLRFAPVHIIRVPQSIFGAPTTNAYLDDIAAYYDANHGSLYRELVYLMSGTDFTNALGQASCIGGAGNGNSHYATGWMLFEQQYSGSIGPFQLYADGSLKTIAHEVGHQLGVRHEQHNCVEILAMYSPTRPMDACTTMAPLVDFHGVGFSTWSRLTSRGLADQRDL